MINIQKGNNEFLLLLPTLPGVYIFYGENEKVLYVGKAKNIKNRVSSYFRNANIGAKTKLLISKTQKIDYIVVNNESESLLLENTLIKKLKPKYNILLKDDKTYPWIVIKNESFPRVMLTRKILHDGSEYFGPFTSALMVKNLLKLLKQLYPLRSCNFDLSEDKIKKNIYRPCLDFHIGLCKAPCIGNQTPNEYLQNIQNVKNILKGNINIVLDYLKSQMLLAANEFRYEEAHELKEKINILSKYHNNSLVVNPKIHNVDVFSYVINNETIVINYLRIINGMLINTYNSYFKLNVDATIEDLLSTVVLQIRNKFNSNAPEVILPIKPNFNIDFVKYSIPKSGDKLKLLHLSTKNATAYLNFILSKNNKISDNESNILIQLQQDLKLKTIPYHIECFDNSNIQGKFPVSACVVFKNGKPDKKEYRHYHIKSINIPNDFQTMKEIVYRRYKRLIEEKKELPQLIVIDGGKGQLNAAIESLKELNIYSKVNIISIAKKLEEIYRPGDSLPLYLDKRSSSLKLIQYLRNEAHRFGISFHRKMRNKSSLQTSLDNIPGIGEKTKEMLLKNFGSLERILNTDENEIIKAIGKTKAIILLNALRDTLEL